MVLIGLPNCIVLQEDFVTTSTLASQLDLSAGVQDLPLPETQQQQEAGKTCLVHAWVLVLPGKREVSFFRCGWLRQVIGIGCAPSSSLHV